LFLLFAAVGLSGGAGLFAETPSPTEWLGRWQTWQKTGTGNSQPLGLYQDLECTKPATTAGDVVMAFRGELDAKGLTFKQADPTKCGTLQFANDRAVLRFDGVDDHYLLDASVPVTSLDLWLRYRLTQPPGGAAAVLFSGSDAKHRDFEENGFRLMTQDYQRSTAQNLPQVLHYSGRDQASAVWMEGLPISTGKGFAGTATLLCLGAGLGPKPQNFVPMDLEALFIGAGIAAEQFAAIDRELGARLDAPRLVCTGDSITDGSHGSQGVRATEEYPSQLQKLRPELLVINNGKWGAWIGRQLPVEALFKPGATLVVFVGTNDLSSGRTGEQAGKFLAAYCQKRRAEGWRVYVATTLPRGFQQPSETTVDFEPRRQELNARVRANYADFADGLIDFAADSRIGDAGDEMDRTYFLADQVHLTAAGAAVLAECVDKVLPKP